MDRNKNPVFPSLTGWVQQRESSATPVRVESHQRERGYSLKKRYREQRQSDSDHSFATYEEACFVQEIRAGLPDSTCDTLSNVVPFRRKQQPPSGSAA